MRLNLDGIILNYLNLFYRNFNLADLHLHLQTVDYFFLFCKEILRRGFVILEKAADHNREISFYSD